MIKKVKNEKKERKEKERKKNEGSGVLEIILPEKNPILTVALKMDFL